MSIWLLMVMRERIVVSYLKIGMPPVRLPVMSSAVGSIIMRGMVMSSVVVMGIGVMVSDMVMMRGRMMVPSDLVVRGRMMNPFMASNMLLGWVSVINMLLNRVSMIGMPPHGVLVHV